MKYRGPMLRQGFAGQGGQNIAAYNPKGRSIGHTIETATKDKILIAYNPDFSTAPSASLEMTRKMNTSLEMTEREIRLH